MDPWEVLGISPASSPRTVKASYRKLCRVVHPDKDNGTTAAFQSLHDAYQKAIAQSNAPERRYDIQEFLDFANNSLPAAKAIRRDDPINLGKLDVSLGLGNTLLHFAAKFNAVECMKVLVTPTTPTSHFFAINDAGESPLSLADGECLNLLQEHLHGKWRDCTECRPSSLLSVPRPGFRSRPTECSKTPLRKTTQYEVHRLNKISSLASDLVDGRKGFDAEVLDRRKGFDADLVERPTFGFYNTLSCGFRKSERRQCPRMDGLYRKRSKRRLERSRPQSVPRVGSNRR